MERARADSACNDGAGAFIYLEIWTTSLRKHMALRTASIIVGESVKSIRYLTAEDGNVHVHARDLMHASGSETQASAPRRLTACSSEPKSAMSLGFVHAGVDKDLFMTKEAVVCTLEPRNPEGPLR